MFSVFFPDQCRLCRRPLQGFTRAPVCAACFDSLAPADPSHVCGRCGQDLPPALENACCQRCRSAPPPFDAAGSFGAYEGDLRRLIHLLKYERMLPLAGPLADKMMLTSARFGPIDLIVPVPLHWRRRWLRGFNQSTLLAEQLAARGGVPCRPRALRRTRRTEVQAGLSDLDRIKNVRGAFAAAARGIEGRRVMLVDDVMTTGATLAAAAAALKNAGAAYVAAFALARAVRQSRVGVAPW